MHRGGIPSNKIPAFSTLARSSCCASAVRKHITQCAKIINNRFISISPVKQPEQIQPEQAQVMPIIDNILRMQLVARSSPQTRDQGDDATGNKSAKRDAEDAEKGRGRTRGNWRVFG